MLIGKFDCGDYSAPHIVDWNNDGKKDVICGESNGKIWLLTNTGTNANPLFNFKVPLRSAGSDLDVGSRSSPTVVDWNRDGRKDLIVGESNGYLLYYENVGTDTVPVFNGYINLLDAGYTSRPDVVDWDNDGVMDLIVGEYNGYVTYYHAVGPMALNDNRLYESAATSIGFKLNAGAANGNRHYLILGSLSGTEPGHALPGGQVILPLNWDPFTDLVLALLNTPVFSGFMGKLNVAGQGSAQFNAPPLPGFAGTMIHFAYTLNNPFDYVSNAAALEVVP